MYVYVSLATSFDNMCFILKPLANSSMQMPKVMPSPKMPGPSGFADPFLSIPRPLYLLGIIRRRFRRVTNIFRQVVSSEGQSTWVNGSYIFPTI